MHKYPIVVEKANSNYSAYSSDVPGCIATGRTRQGVAENMQQAIIFHIKGLQEDGLTVPEPSSFTKYIEV